MRKLDHSNCGSWTIFVVEVGPFLLGKLDTRLRTRLFLFCSNSATNTMGVITAYRQTLFLDLKREMPRQCHLFSDHTSQFGTQRRIRDPRILCNRAFDVRQSGE
ncbi:hypothetical protein BL0496 [Bifidobacterium longum NCC2705]|uniref:Uncharacterized protein n=1 Tax=Bifidobacterium longum (strain NCC 2705) TaxID=206672 RepID=Q8G6Y4_BIFLO|nr:hypothetical protein BL0496 [Bifidobacterium longum NCC2705]